MINKKIIFYGLILCALGASPLGADPQINASISTQKLTLHEKTVLKINMEWPQDDPSYTFALPEFKSENLMLERQGESQEVFLRDNQTWIRKTVALEFKPIKPGMARIESFSVNYIEPTGLKNGTFQVLEYRLEVKKDPALISPKLLGIGLVVCTGLIIFLMVFVKISVKKSVVENHSRPSAYEEKFLQRLNAIDIELIEKNPRNAIYELSSLWRQYLAVRFQLEKGDEQTIIDRLQNNEILDRQEFKTIKTIHDQFHEMKFAGTVISVWDFKNIKNEISAFIAGKSA